MQTETFKAGEIGPFLEENKSRLEYARRWLPLYTSAFHEFLKELHSEPYVSVKNLRQEFFETFHRYITGSRLNRLEGLNSFTRRDVIIGVTQSIDDLHFVHKGNVVVFPGEYKYHHLIYPEVRVKKAEDLQCGDVLILSVPFSNSGNMHPDTLSALDLAAEKGALVHLDCAWYGCTRDLRINVNHPSVRSVSFSLSKGLGLGRHRIGVRYARERWNGPVCATNDSDYPHDSLMWVAIKFMEKFGPDYLQNNYYPIYQKVCAHYGFEETNSIFVAWDGKHESPQGVGVRPLVRYLAEGRW